MYCTSCGKVIDGNSKVCPFCGKTVVNRNPQVKDNSVPTFETPVDEIPTFSAPGNSANETTANNDEVIPVFKAPSEDIPTFTEPARQQFTGPACHYHNDEPAVGRCARCGKPLCQDCCDSYGVISGEYAGKPLCYDCTQELVAENVSELTANLNKIKGQFILQIVGMVIGFFFGISGGFGSALICACIGGVFLSALKAFFSLAWDCIKIAFAGRFGILTIISIIFNLVVIVGKCIFFPLFK